MTSFSNNPVKSTEIFKEYVFLFLRFDLKLAKNLFKKGTQIGESIIMIKLCQ